MISLPILNYHSISQGGTDHFGKFTLRPEMFAQHMKLISDQGYTPLTVKNFAHSVRGFSSLPNKPVIITFDDGFSDFYTAAFPILQEFRFPATLYVVTDDIDGTSKWIKPNRGEYRKMLTWSQLAEIQKAGIECGAHSATHIHLDVAEPEIARQEITRSKDTLEQKLGCQIHSMAYPYGHYTKTVRQMVVEAGYSAACAVRNAISHVEDNLFSLARMTIYRETGVGILENLLAGKVFALASPYEDPLVTGWRLVRQVLNRVNQK
jgi:peptidoglycan/xylan/chitin deacetylase (PgdA/CDA1 family)